MPSFEINVYPYQSVNGVVTLWNTVITHVRADGRRQFYRLLPPMASPAP